MHKKSCRSVLNNLMHFNHLISSNKHPGSYLKFKLKGGWGGAGGGGVRVVGGAGGRGRLLRNYSS